MVRRKPIHIIGENLGIKRWKLELPATYRKRVEQAWVENGHMADDLPRVEAMFEGGVDALGSLIGVEKKPKEKSYRARVRKRWNRVRQGDDSLQAVESIIDSDVKFLTGYAGERAKKVRRINSHEKMLASMDRGSESYESNSGMMDLLRTDLELHDARMQHANKVLVGVGKFVLGKVGFGHVQRVMRSESEALAAPLYNYLLRRKYEEASRVHEIEELEGRIDRISKALKDPRASKLAAEDIGAMAREEILREKRWGGSMKTRVKYANIYKGLKGAVTPLTSEKVQVQAKRVRKLMLNRQKAQREAALEQARGEAERVFTEVYGPDFPHPESVEAKKPLDESGSVAAHRVRMPQEHFSELSKRVDADGIGDKFEELISRTLEFS